MSLSNTSAISADAHEAMPAHEAIIHALKDAGIDTIFGYPGGAIMPIYDGLAKVDHSITHILAASEGGAGHMAAGYARATGKTGVLFVTSGPGLTNALTPIADAQGDSTPMVVISGQVASHLIGTDAFQEVPATLLTMPITKYNILVKNPADVLPSLRRAFAIAADGRPGVVHVDIPKDIQNMMVEYTQPIFKNFTKPQPVPDFDLAADLMRRAVRPIFYVGGGVIHAGGQASAALMKLIEDTGFPSTSTLMGLGAYPTTSPAHLGMLGMHGTYEANTAMHEADLIIAVGARFDDRVTGKLYDDAGVRLFSPQARIIQIDIDKAEIGKLVRADVPLMGDAAEMLVGLTRAIKKSGPIPQAPLKPWWRDIAQWRAVDSLACDAGVDDIRAPQVLQQFAGILKTLPDYVVATNVGQHQMWTAQYLPFTKPRQFLTSGKVGTMGYGLPAAIGALQARPEIPTFVITGDGSWRMNTPEVETACRYNLPVKVISLDNQSLNMVGQWQRDFHGGRLSQSQFNNSSKDFCAEFRAQGNNAKAERITRPEQLGDALKRMMAHDGPYFLQIMVRNENCYPMVAAGSAHHEMMLAPETIARNPHLA